MENRDIDSFLKTLGEARYIPLFNENEIGLQLLMDLSEKHLKATLAELGLKLGTQMKILIEISSMKMKACEKDQKSAGCREHQSCDEPNKSLLKKQREPENSTELQVNFRSQHTRLIVAAIDFGTHGSGLVFCFKENYREDYRKIFSINAGSNITKIPTTVLMEPNGKKYDSVGEEAETKFMDMDTETQKEYYLFKGFKMMLFDTKNLSETTPLKDVNDKVLPAIDVFAAVIEYFKNRLQKKVIQCTYMNSSLLNYDDVFWVITVPAIWDLPAKQFMRRAAEKAGLKDEQVSLALEPEAASMYCRRIPVEVCAQREGGKAIASLPAGSKYLVIDLGGGTVDITAHEVMDDGGLRELHHASGGYFGGTCVNEEIMAFLRRIVSGPVLKELKDKHPDDYLDLMKTIEQKKCSYKNSADQEKIVLKIPGSLLRAFEKDYECELGTDLENTPFANSVKVYQDKIHISKELFKTFFDKSIKNVVETIKEILVSSEMSNVNIILLVGGYAESPLLTETIADAFPDKKVVVPANPVLSVLEGAIIYGFEPDMIVSRVSRYTYGIATLRKWQLGDPVDKKLPKKGKDSFHWCDGIFDKHIEIGQIVKVGEFQKEKEYFTVEGPEKAILDFYASNKKNPTYVDEEGCFRVGYFVLNLSKKKRNERVLVKISFGGTELNVEVTGENTGQGIQTSCNFLP